MSKLTPAQLIELLRGEGNPPPGFVNVPPEHVYSGVDPDQVRIDYNVFFNASTNQLIVSGTARPQPLGGDGMGSSPTISDAGIFYDSTVITSGADAGKFPEKPIPVAQTEDLISGLTSNEAARYPGASITFVGEGSAGLAFSMASYNARQGSVVSGPVEGTVTLNSWLGQWTADGKPDAGVLDVRTRDVALGDPAYSVGATDSGVANLGWLPGGSAVMVDPNILGIDATPAMIVTDVASQEAVDAAGGFVSSLIPDSVGNLGAMVAGDLWGWVMSDLKPSTVDGLTGWVGHYVSHPG